MLVMTFVYAFVTLLLSMQNEYLAVSWPDPPLACSGRGGYTRLAAPIGTEIYSKIICPIIAVNLPPFLNTYPY